VTPHPARVKKAERAVVREAMRRFNPEEPQQSMTATVMLWRGLTRACCRLWLARHPKTWRAASSRKRKVGSRA